jgi:hypothetical protein
MRQHVALLVALDALAAATALGLARVLNFGLDPARLQVRSFAIPYGVLALAIVPTWLAVLAIKGAYDIGPFGTAVRGRRVIRAGADFLALVAVAYFVLHLEELARGFLAAAVPLAVALTLALRWGAARVLCARRRRGLAVRRAVIVGSRGNVGEIVRRLAVRRSTELEPLAACVPGPREPFVVDGRRVPVLGGPDDVLTALEVAEADTLVLTGDLAHGRVRRLAWALEGSGVDVFVIPALAHQAMEIDVRPVAGLPLVYVEPGRRQDRRPAPPKAVGDGTGEREGTSWVGDAGPVAGPAVGGRPMAPPPSPPVPVAPSTNGANGANGTNRANGPARARPARTTISGSHRAVVTPPGA